MRNLLHDAVNITMMEVRPPWIRGSQTVVMPWGVTTSLRRHHDMGTYVLVSRQAAAVKFTSLVRLGVTGIDH